MKFQPGTKTTTKIIVVDEKLNAPIQVDKPLPDDGQQTVVAPDRYARKVC